VGSHAFIEVNIRKMENAKQYLQPRLNLDLDEHCEIPSALPSGEIGILCRAGTELSSLGLQVNSNLTTPLCWNLTAISPRLHGISVACL